MSSAYALDIISGIIIFFRNSGKSADFPELPFHGWGRDHKRHLQHRGQRPRPLSLATLASSPKGRALGMAVQFLVRA